MGSEYRVMVLIFWTPMLSEHHRNYSQSLQYFFNFGFLGPLHNLSIRLLTAAADKSFSVHSVIMKPLRKAILQLIRCRCTEGVRRKWKNSLTTHFKSVHRGDKFKFPQCAYKWKLILFSIYVQRDESVNSLIIKDCDY